MPAHVVDSKLCLLVAAPMQVPGKHMCPTDDDLTRFYGRQARLLEALALINPPSLGARLLSGRL